MIYQVTKQFSVGSEQPCQQFKTLDDAKAYANQKAASDAVMKIKAIYRVYEFDVVKLTVDSTTIVPITPDSPTESSAGGMQSGATFKPTPFEMSPRPKGTPPKWIIDPEDDKSKDK